jgi:hypothetical protein
MTLLVVDAANVVGSVPDGWWRDRRGATERLRDSLAGRRFDLEEPVEIVLVVEGAARGVEAVPGVRVVAAERSGDDAIVEVVRGAEGPCVVATADRELIARVEALGARVVGPRSVRSR